MKLKTAACDCMSHFDEVIQGSVISLVNILSVNCSKSTAMQCLLDFKALFDLI